MADAAARREARKKRILDNLQSRLEKITGRKEDINDYKDDGFTQTGENGLIPTIPVEEFSSILHGRATSKSSLTVTPLSVSDSNESLSEPVEHPTDTRTEKKIPKHDKVFYLSNQIVIAILAILTRFCYIFKLEHFFSNLIFIPLLLFEMITIVFTQTKKQELGVMGAALLLSGIPQNVTNSMSKYLDIIRKITQDFCVYFFTFIVTHLILESLHIFSAEYFKYYLDK